MYLKSLKIANFRKFRYENDKIEFVDAQSYQQQKKSQEIDVAPTTTLIVGKNNVGKTTVIKALDKLINNGSFKSKDFNFNYLKELFEEYKENIENAKPPFLEFIVEVGIDKNSDDLLTNLIPFMTLADIDSSELKIVIRYEAEDDKVFFEFVSKLLAKKYDPELEFSKFLDLIDELAFKSNYYDKNNEKIASFKLSELIELRTIGANKIEGEHCLSDAFNKIINYRYDYLLKDRKENLESQLIEMNKRLTESIADHHTKDINESVSKVISSSKLEVLLTSNLTLEELVRNLIKYEYVEEELKIPENQFGLGYTNLMKIIADLIDYMEKYPEESFNSKINLISIEEPETFMHPQMQELFIKNINNAITTLLKSRKKNLNSQLIITTHSSHILNSKIHSGDSFNNINYITTTNGKADIVCLNDEKIVPQSVIEDKKDSKSEAKKQLDFLKKHIKYKVSELFFSDAVIFVEGVTEDTLLRYYIDQDECLSKYYISVFNIDGCHGLVYYNLIKLLRVPTLIITDLDIQRSDKEKGETAEKSFDQITDLRGRETTNKTIEKLLKDIAANDSRIEKTNNDKYTLDRLPKYIQDINMCFLYQGSVQGYFATSFEEAFILTNYDNRILNSVLKELKPDIYKSIVGENNDYVNNIHHSFKWQAKLSKTKSEFANSLLYEFVNMEAEDNAPILPEYIQNGLNWLKTALSGGRNNAV